MINPREGVGGSLSAMTISDADFTRLVKFIQTNYGIDLSQKKQLITGRLSTAIKQRGYQSFSDFVNHVLQTKDNDEITLLLDKLTTNYTAGECQRIFRRSGSSSGGVRKSGSCQGTGI